MIATTIIEAIVAVAVTLGTGLTIILWLLQRYKSGETEREALIEKLAKDVFDLKEQWNETRKKWMAAAAIGSPDCHQFYDEWMSLTKRLVRTEYEYERLTGKAAGIH